MSYKKILIIFIATTIFSIALLFNNTDNNNSEKGIDKIYAITNFDSITIKSHLGSNYISSTSNGLIAVRFTVTGDDGGLVCEVFVKDSADNDIPMYTGTGALQNGYYINNDIGEYQYSFEPQIQEGNISTEGVVKYMINCDSGISSGWQTNGTDGEVLTIDNTPPTISSVIAKSDNIYTDNIVKEDDTITLEIIVSEELLVKPNVKIDNKIATVNKDEFDSQKYYATIIINSAEIYTESANLEYVITNVKDKASNSMIETEIIDTIEVQVDIVLPTISNVVITIKDSSDIVAKIGDTITLTLEASEELLITQSNVTILGKTLYFTKVESNPLIYSTEITLTENDYDQGILNYQINYMDLAGNIGEEIINSSNLIVDTIPPSIEDVIIYSNNINNNYAKNGDLVTLTFTLSEELNGLPIVTINGVNVSVEKIGATLEYTVVIRIDNTYQQGIIIFTIDYIDIAGNKGIQVTNTSNSSSVIIDTVAPFIPNINDNNYYNKDLVINVIDDNLETILLNGETIENNITLTSDLSYSLIITDKAGNTLAINFTLDKTTLKFVGIRDGGHYNYDLSIFLDSDDLSRMIINGEDIVDLTVVQHLVEDGEYNIIVYDYAGNKSEITVVIDKIAPTLLENSVINASIKVESEFIEYAYSFSTSGPWHNWTHLGESVNSYNLNNVLEDGIYYIKVKDKAGNISSEYITLQLDRIAPKINVENNLPYIYEINTENIDWTKYFTINDNIDGDITVTNEMINSQVEMNKVGTYKVTLSVKDTAGNESIKEINIKIQDSSFKLPPFVAISIIIILIFGILYIVYLIIKSATHIKVYSKK